MTLQQFRALQLPPLLQRTGELVGGVGVVGWFWWILVEQGVLGELMGQPELVEILLGLPLILILPALYYTAVFILLRVLYWLLVGDAKEPVDRDDLPAP